jgi:putative PIN family toxin of toxin-antitoxin system
MEVVLDTNVIASALLSPSGLPAKILNLVLDGTITIAYDNNILAEYADVLNRRKFKFNKELISIIMDFIVKEGIFRIAKAQKVKFQDEDDTMFYELYKSDGIDYLITGNARHFPREKGIVSPKLFLKVDNFSS